MAAIYEYHSDAFGSCYIAIKLTKVRNTSGACDGPPRPEREQSPSRKNSNLTTKIMSLCVRWWQ